MPPLRERKEDIPALMDHFFEKNNARHKLRLLNTDIYKRFMEYHWPGNVRELENIVERMIAISEVGAWDTEIFEPLQNGSRQPKALVGEGKEYPSYQEFMSQKEWEIIDWALKKANNNVSLAAELLGLPRSTLRSKMEKI